MITIDGKKCYTWDEMIEILFWMQENGITLEKIREKKKRMEMTNKEYSNLILEYFNGEKVEVDASKPLEVYAALAAELCRQELSKESALEWINAIGEIKE